MRYAGEYRKLVAVAVLLLAVLIYFGYRERPEAPGDDTPLEHEMGGDPPPDVREP